MDKEIIKQLMKVPDINELTKVLCIQPHPDDNEIGMGATIAKFTASNCRVDYLTVTDGSLGDNGFIKFEGSLSEVRKNEARAAGKVLGVSNYFWLDYFDGSLENIHKLAHQMAEIIRAEQYDAIFCPDPWLPYEAHQDHIVTGKSAAQAAINCSLKKYPADTETDPVTLKAVGFYFTNRPNTKNVITSFFDKKFEAIAEHKSQTSPEILELYRGFFYEQGKELSGTEEVCEGFKVLAPLHMHCFPSAESI